LEEYLDHIANGRKYCWRCQQWHHVDAFGRDSQYTDGLAHCCRASRRVQVKKDMRGPTRLGDKEQAWWRISRLESRGKIPRASAFQCAFNVGPPGNRHRCTRQAEDWHHFAGYDSYIAQFTVTPVCRKHHKVLDKLLREQMAKPCPCPVCSSRRSAAAKKQLAERRPRPRRLVRPRHLTPA